MCSKPVINVGKLFWLLSFSFLLWLKSPIVFAAIDLDGLLNTHDFYVGPASVEHINPSSPNPDGFAIYIIPKADVFEIPYNSNVQFLGNGNTYVLLENIYQRNLQGEIIVDNNFYYEYGNIRTGPFTRKLTNPRDEYYLFRDLGEKQLIDTTRLTKIEIDVRDELDNNKLISISDVDGDGLKEITILHDFSSNIPSEGPYRARVTGQRFELSSDGERLIYQNSAYEDLYSSEVVLDNPYRPAFIPTQAETENLYAGATRGAAEVDSFGGASYVLPIKLPRASGLYSPALSFVYSTNGGASLMGQGWSVAGISMIERCSRDVRNGDLINTDVSYNESDALCLGGNRLFQINRGEVGYWDEGARYKFERDNLTEVTRISGNRFEFVDSSGTRDVYAQITPAIWKVVESKDMFGNTISYDYIDDEFSIFPAIDTISYGPYTIRFEYVFGREDLIFQVIGSSVRYENRFLKQVSIEYEDQFGNSNKIREYNAHYQSPNRSYNKRLVLKQLQECAYDSNGDNKKCLRALDIASYTGGLDYVKETIEANFLASLEEDIHLTRQLDWNGDGLLDTLFVTKKTDENGYDKGGVHIRYSGANSSVEELLSMSEGAFVESIEFYSKFDGSKGIVYQTELDYTEENALIESPLNRDITFDAQEVYSDVACAIASRNTVFDESCVTEYWNTGGRSQNCEILNENVDIDLTLLQRPDISLFHDDKYRLKRYAYQNDSEGNLTETLIGQSDYPVSLECRASEAFDDNGRTQDNRKLNWLLSYESQEIRSESPDLVVGKRFNYGFRWNKKEYDQNSGQVSLVFFDSQYCGIANSRESVIGNAKTPPLVTDLNGDGELEIIVPGRKVEGEFCRDASVSQYMAGIPGIEAWFDLTSESLPDNQTNQSINITTQLFAELSIEAITDEVQLPDFTPFLETIVSAPRFSDIANSNSYSSNSDSTRSYISQAQPSANRLSAPALPGHNVEFTLNIINDDGSNTTQTDTSTNVNSPSCSTVIQPRVLPPTRVSFSNKNNSSCADCYTQVPTFNSQFNYAPPTDLTSIEFQSEDCYGNPTNLIQNSTANTGAPGPTNNTIANTSVSSASTSSVSSSSTNILFSDSIRTHRGQVKVYEYSAERVVEADLNSDGIIDSISFSDRASFANRSTIPAYLADIRLGTFTENGEVPWGKHRFNALFQLEDLAKDLRLIDYNQDGFMDFAFRVADYENNQEQIQIYQGYISERGEFRLRDTQLAFPIQNDSLFDVYDHDGDGFDDVVVYGDATITLYKASGRSLANVSYAFTNSFDGYDHTVALEYANLYELNEIGRYTWSQNIESNGDREIINSSRVVKRLIEPVTTSSSNIVDYSYYSAKASPREGRLMGFERIDTESVLYQQKVHRYFVGAEINGNARSFPNPILAGFPLRTDVFNTAHETPKLVSSTLNDWRTQSTAFGTELVYLNKTYTANYDRAGAQISAIMTENSLDGTDYGHLESTTTTLGYGGSDPITCAIDDRVSAVELCNVGTLVQQTVHQTDYKPQAIKYLSNSNVTVTNSFTMPAEWQAQYTEFAGSTDISTQSLATTNIEHSDFPNIVASTISGITLTSGSATRVDYEFGAPGNATGIPISTKIDDANADALGNLDLMVESRETSVGNFVLGLPTTQLVHKSGENLETTTEYDYRYGAPIKTTNPIGIVSETTLDQFGRPVLSSKSSGTAIRTTYELCEDVGVTCPSSYAEQAVYKVSKTQVDLVSNVDETSTYTYIDPFGRTIASVALDFDGQEVITAQTYDNRGRPKARSLPFCTHSNCSSPLYSTINYSDTEEVVVSYAADGAISQTSYDRLDNGLTRQLSVTTNRYLDENGVTQDRTVKSESLSNTLNQIVETKDWKTETDSVTTKYFYDVNSRLVYSVVENLVTEMDRAGESEVVSVSSSVTMVAYDDENATQTLWDPDSGKTVKRYNVLGELVQSDAYGLDPSNLSPRTLKQSYDEIGRMVSQIDMQDGTADQWFYDSYPADNESLWSPTVNFRCLNGQLCQTSANGGLYQERYSYVQAGQYGEGSVDTVETSLKSAVAANRENFLAFTNFGPLDRVSTMTYPSSFQVSNEYKNGFLHRVHELGADNTPSATLWEATSYSEFGALEKYSLGNGLSIDRQYDPFGKLVGQDASLPLRSLGLLSSQRYQFDSSGTLMHRSHSNYRYDQASDSFALHNQRRQSFSYDGLTRLLAVEANQESFTNGVQSDSKTTQAQFEYDDFGNILKKGNSSLYSYSHYRDSQACGSVGGSGANYSPGPHAVRESAESRHCYDTYGAIVRSELIGPDGVATGSGVREISYNSINKPLRVEKDNNILDFAYGLGEQRYYKRSQINGVIQETFYLLGGAVEQVVESNGQSTITTYVGGYLVHTQKDNQPASKSYILRDHQGSITNVYSDDLISDLNNALLSEMSFEAFGKRSIDYDQDGQASALRGYTGHENFGDFDIIHMNGRVYDPTVGRFLSPDPYVQAPYFSQSYNRYSYVWNNPFSMTDPSGYIGLSDDYESLPFDARISVADDETDSVQIDLDYGSSFGLDGLGGFSFDSPTYFDDALYLSGLDVTGNGYGRGDTSREPHGLSALANSEFAQEQGRRTGLSGNAIARNIAQFIGLNSNLTPLGLASANGLAAMVNGEQPQTATGGSGVIRPRVVSTSAPRSRTRNTISAIQGSSYNGDTFASKTESGATASQIKGAISSTQSAMQTASPSFNLAGAPNLSKSRVTNNSTSTPRSGTSLQIGAFSGAITGCFLAVCVDLAVNFGISIDTDDFLNSKFFGQVSSAIALGIGFGGAASIGNSIGISRGQLESGFSNSSSQTFIGFAVAPVLGGVAGPAASVSYDHDPNSRGFGGIRGTGVGIGLGGVAIGRRNSINYVSSSIRDIFSLSH